jgi:amidase
MPIESTIDHVGPITATVADNALLLEVLAGSDGLDPRQYAPTVAPYTAALGQEIDGLKIGVVKQGFGWPNSEADVDDSVRAAGAVFAAKGAIVTEVDLPLHAIGKDIWSPIALEGLQMQMMHGNGMGFNWKGQYTVSLLDAHAAWRERADDLSASLKLSMLVGEYFLRHHRGRFYAKAQNQARRLRAAYDAALAEYDLLLMPTLPMKATPLPGAGAPLGEIIQRAFEMVANTAPFDVTGHPAMSIPCAMHDDLPIGMMLIGRMFDEPTIYRAADWFERNHRWETA